MSDYSYWQAKFDVKGNGIPNTVAIKSKNSNAIKNTSIGDRCLFFSRTRSVAPLRKTPKINVKHR